MPKDCTRRVMTVRLFVSCGLRVCRNLLVMLLVAQGSSGNANGTETPGPLRIGISAFWRAEFRLRATLLQTLLQTLDVDLVVGGGGPALSLTNSTLYSLDSYALL